MIDTLSIAKQNLNVDRFKGTVCPCCDRFVKVYKRRIYHTPALYLIALYRLTKIKGDKYYHVTEVMQQLPARQAIRMKNDSHKASYFGLLEELKDETYGKKSSGYWRLTDDGKRYVEGTLKIPRYAFIFNSEVIGYSSELSDIDDALAKRFNYLEIMQSIDQHELKITEKILPKLNVNP